MTVRDFIWNHKFDVDRPVKVVACTKEETWDNGGKTMFEGFPNDAPEYDDWLDKPIYYITVATNAIIIEVRI